MPVTRKDVASRANVSPAVVTKVLHGKLDGVRVSEPTAERVREAARELGYRVNVWARNFRAQKAMMVGVLNGMGVDVPSFSKGPRYFATLMDGVVQGCFKHGYSVALCPELLSGNPMDAINDGRFAGLLWYSVSPTNSTLEALKACAVPSVIAHARSDWFGKRYSTVACDNAQGIGLAVEHLAEKGHRRIAFALESDAPNVETRERLQGYRKHMERLGLTVEPGDILDFPKDRVQLRNYFAAGPDHTAIVVHADGLAADMIRFAPEFGVRIPDDLSIIGFDSTEFCDGLQPPLTSVSQPLEEIGRRSVELLIRLVDGEETEPREILLPCGLDVRESTGPARS